MNKPKVAVIINSSLGWKSIRESWTRELSGHGEFEFVFLSLENYRDHIPFWVRRLKRFSSLSEIFMGRAAAKDAIRQGCEKIVIATLHNAGALPERNGVRYFIYGDATIRQLDSFGYYSKSTAELPAHKKALNALIRTAYKAIYDSAVRRLLKRGHTFLCMSRWYADGLAKEFPGIGRSLRILPPSVDTRHWTPPAGERDRKNLVVLFLGGDFERKGGDLVLAASRMPEFKDVHFHFVTRSAPQGIPGNATVHTGMQANSQALVDLLRSSDLLVLPTRADCSSVAALECAAVGLPAVIRGLAGIPELVQDGATGILLKHHSVEEVAAAIRFYQQHPEALRQHGMAARKYAAENFDTRVATGQLLACLRE